ncbi:hypothetical protein JVU11DRAFT_825 [Chiua virens]|nr:hypothetical protein JVU11DRAFT_825 [Chiua virens]
MAVTEGKKKKPPSFHFLPKTRAKQLKKSWVEDRKIRSKWKAQKKREGLSGQPRRPVDDASEHIRDDANANSEPEASSTPRDKSITPTPVPHHDRQSLRDLRRIAYTANPPRTQKSDSSHSKRDHHIDRSGKPLKHENGQPNMKLRMNVLLERIKRDFS